MLVGLVAEALFSVAEEPSTEVEDEDAPFTGGVDQDAQYRVHARPV
jgi:hypothetical protein